PPVSGNSPVRFLDLRAPALTALLALAGGCQGSSGTDLPKPTNTGTGGSSGGSGRLDGGGSGDVTITILTPKAMEVIKGGTSPEVRAKIVSVRPGSMESSTDGIDGSSVHAELREP